MADFCGENINCVRGERQVLHGAGFALSSGHALILRGANGTGKSTLLRLMAGLMRPRAGKITWDGSDIAEDQTEHNRRIAYIGHADAVKPALSVIENVAFWGTLADGNGMTAPDALKTLGISHLAELPARYLSAGQRRRVSLTRALTSGAALWLLDEPTTSLDTATTVSLKEQIETHLASGGMAVISTHTDMGLNDAKSLTLGQNV